MEKVLGPNQAVSHSRFPKGAHLCGVHARCAAGASALLQAVWANACLGNQSLRRAVFSSLGGNDGEERKDVKRI